jgi:hypothetical protein
VIIVVMCDKNSSYVADIDPSLGETSRNTITCVNDVMASVDGKQI